MKKITTVLICIFMLIGNNLAAQAFIDDIIDDIKDKIEEERIAVDIRTKDLAFEENLVSNTPRQIKIILKYRKEYRNKITSLAPTDLAEILEDNLVIRRIIAGQDESEIVYDMNFETQFQSVKGGDSDYRLAHFVSNELTMNQHQRLSFTLRTRAFLSDLDINPSSDIYDLTTKVSKLNFKPIKHKLKNFSFEQSQINNGTLIGDEAFQGNIYASFSSDKQLNLNATNASMQFIKNDKINRPFFRFKGNRKALNADDIEISNITISQNEEDSYQIMIPISLKLRNSKQKRFIKSGKARKVVIPIRVIVRTTDDLKVLLEGRAALRIPAI